VSRRELIDKLILEVANYIEKLEEKYKLTDEEIVQILDAVKSEYEWEDY